MNEVTLITRKRAASRPSAPQQCSGAEKQKTKTVEFTGFRSDMSPQRTLQAPRARRSLEGRTDVSGAEKLQDPRQALNVVLVTK